MYLRGMVGGYFVTDQSKKASIIESSLNVASGFVLSWLTWCFIVGSIFNINTNVKQGFKVTCLFTCVSLIRCYVWRRVFNHFQNRRDSAK